MPFLRVVTNASRSQFSRDFMPKFSSYMAGVLGKDQAAMKWAIETDREMAMVKVIKCLALPPLDTHNVRTHVCNATTKCTYI